jgi:DNA primase
MKFETAVLEIKRRVDIVRVIGQYVPLKKAGNSWIGLCPFHSEKSPSFHVRSDKGYFKCFGCDAGGDIFTFLEKKTGQLFKDIVDRLAQETGVQIDVTFDANEEKKQQHNDRLLKCLLAAQTYFQSALLSHLTKLPLGYLTQERKLTPDLIQMLQLGFGGGNDQDFVAFLKTKEISLEDAIELGILRENSYGFQSLFLRRITIPIFNHKGQLVGFGGRVFGQVAKNLPKYINSKASCVYDKGAVLYGLFESLSLVRQKKIIVITEGYFDVIAIRSAGFAAVAPCGTSLTEEHIKLLQRYSQDVILCLDQDEAGKKAHKKMLKMLLHAGFQVRTALIKEKDPDTLHRLGQKHKLKEILSTAPNAVEVLIRETKDQADLGVTERIAAITALIPFLGASPIPLINHQYIRLAAQILREEEFALLKEVSKINSAMISSTNTAPYLRQSIKPANLVKRIPATNQPAWRAAEKLFLRAILEHPEVMLNDKEYIPAGLNVELTDFLLNLQKKHTENPAIPPQEILQSISVTPGTILVSVLLESVKIRGKMTKEEAQKIFEGTVKRHEQKKQRQFIQKNQEALAWAEKKGDFALVKQLLLQQTKTLREHKKLYAQPSPHVLTSSKTTEDNSPVFLPIKADQAKKSTVQIFEEDLRDDEGWT